MCYEDLRQLYAAAAKERDELKKELAYTKQLYEMARAERAVAVKTVEAGTLPDRRCVVSGRHENGVFYSNMTGEDLANILNAYASGMLVPVVHGEWVECDDDECDCIGDVYCHHKCSNCNTPAPYGYKYREDWDEGMDGEWYSLGIIDDGIIEHLTPYCPNCGARMDGGLYGSL